MSELAKRDWVYIQPPKAYEIAPCSCGNNNCQWSEFKKHLWCEKCQKDFVPEHNGVFDGPIPIQVSAMFGIYFDLENISDGTIDFCEIKKSGINWIKISPEQYKEKFEERLKEIPLIDFNSCKKVEN